VAGVLAAVLAGCSLFSPDPLPTVTTSALPRTTPPPSSLIPSPTPTATPTPTPTPTLSEEEAAIAAARPVIDAYFKMDEEMAHDPASFATERFKEVAVGSALLDLENEQSFYLANGYHTTGNVTVVDVSVESVRLEAPVDDQGRWFPPNVVFRVCLDVSDVDGLDSTGKSAIDPNRPDEWVYRVGVSNNEPPDGPWLVEFTEQKPEETC
jgi:hypothetical protein